MTIFTQQRILALLLAFCLTMVYPTLSDPYEAPVYLGMAEAGTAPTTSTGSSRHLAFASSAGNPQSVARKEPPSHGKEDQQQQHLVLIGGGHAHVQVIKALNAASRPANLRVTLIDAVQSASYSGMVPGCVAGYYQPEETQLHLKPLAEWASIDFINEKVADLDLDNKLIYLQDREEGIAFDAVSMDIGSTSRDMYTVKGAAAYSIPTRPIHKLIERIEKARLAAVETTTSNHNNEPLELVVIGGGAAGIELALSVTSRWKKSQQGENMKCTLLDAGQQLLPQESDSARQQLGQVLTNHNIQVRHECTVQEITESTVLLTTGQEIPYTHCIWATGAGAHDLSKHLHTVCGLDCSAHGWIQVEPTFQSTSHPFVFAAGDCASIQNLKHGSPPKAGVYAVRAGPVLIENLTRYLQGSDLLRYEPQDDFLKLIGCGDGKAMGFRFGLSMQGRWVWELKNQIDRNFMKLFDVTDLPKPQPGSSYDTSQYDEKDLAAARKMPRIEPEEAATLLQRTDDDVDFLLAWRTLRSMGEDESYRDAVLNLVSIPLAALQTPQ
jgi:selenide,water dikinase